MTTLQDFLATRVFAFLLTFVRVGAAVMIMPGVGDSFVNSKVRLYFALGFSFVLFPVLMPHLPDPIPTSVFALAVLIFTELVTGLLLGSIARIFMAALDIAGMVVSFSSSLSNAQLFNPGLSQQGSLVGAFLSVTGVVFLFATNMHHLLIMGVVETYELFPVGGALDTGSMAEIMARALSASFAIGVKIGAPFLVLILLIYVGMGVLSRVMPQIQVFILALPLQILLSLVMLSMVLGVGLYYWIREFSTAMSYFLGG